MRRTDLVADYLRHRPGVWVDYRELASVGVFGGWRTRISQARLEFGMQIENRVRVLPGGVRISEYMFVPSEPVQSPLWGAGDAA